jgi:hypothetical protein
VNKVRVYRYRRVEEERRPLAIYGVGRRVMRVENDIGTQTRIEKGFRRRTRTRQVILPVIRVVASYEGMRRICSWNMRLGVEKRQMGRCQILPTG